jgi:hypothetical protein
MNSPPKPVAEARNKLASPPTGKVLVVEGPEDLAVYTEWLKKLAAPNPFDATLQLVKAEGKNNVLKCLRWFADNGGEPRVFGLVDRDEWDAATIAQQLTTLPQLRVNAGRHAIESYFCDPNEIAPALSAIDPAWTAQFPTFRAALDAALADYVGHWALLTSTDRLKGRMGEQGYPGHFSQTVPVPPDADIRARFAQWAATFDTDAAFAEFDSIRGGALAATTTARYRSHVWAKRFFDAIVQPQLNGPPTAQQQSGLDWMVDLAEKSPHVPPDAETILRPLL